MRAIKDFEFRPVWSCFGGDGQTLMAALKEHRTKHIKYSYDKSEDFELSDGGIITLDYKGDFSLSNYSEKPVILFLCGQTHHSHTGKIWRMIEELSDEFDSVVINWRGEGLNSSGEPQTLRTPKIYNGAAHDDFLEPARYIYETYCRI